MTEGSVKLAATPPMGWNGWNQFGQELAEEIVRANADAIVSTGMRELGYQYVNIDDCWSDKRGRDKNGDLVADPERFPSGIKALADYVHSAGLKLGIYSDAAELTCAGWPGSYRNEERDAKLFAGWGVDLLKYDYCHAPDDRESAIERYLRMGEALAGCGREILFSVCEWGRRRPHLWGRDVKAHMWRVTSDVIDAWVSDLDWCVGINEALEMGAHHHRHAGPGAWNDMDMLVVGLRGTGQKGGLGSGCTDHEYRAQMSMWCILCSPLLAGCDLSKMDRATADLLMNPEVISVNQDPLGKQGVFAARCGLGEVWKKPLSDGSLAVCLLNRGESPAEIEAAWRVLGLPPAERVEVRDLWAREDIGAFKNRFSLRVPPHGTAMLRCAPTKPAHGG
jgi:alpha-galactosidase